MMHRYMGWSFAVLWPLSLYFPTQEEIGRLILELSNPLGRECIHEWSPHGSSRNTDAQSPLPDRTREVLTDLVEHAQNPNGGTPPSRSTTAQAKKNTTKRSKRTRFRLVSLQSLKPAV